MRRLLLILAVALAGAFPAQARAATYTVTTQAELQTTLGLVSAGDTIKLSFQPWDVLDLSDRNYGTGSAQVTITGKTNAGIATVRGADLSNTTGVKLGEIAFDGNAADDIIYDTSDGVGNNIDIVQSTFTNAKNFLHIHGGKDLMVKRNRFGQNTTCTASVILEPSQYQAKFEDVTIQNNLFQSTGCGGRKGVFVKSIHNELLLPVNVRIVNNTIITPGGGVGIDLAWSEHDRSLHPLVANNVMSVFETNGRGQLFSNLAESGTAESGMEIGAANLNADLSPSASSTLVIDLANTTYAPTKDFYDLTRVGPPDRGAIEYR